MKLRLTYMSTGSALMAVTMLAGCSLNGKWSLTEVEPTAARRDFTFSAITFQDDGTFYAEGEDALDRDLTMSGTYKYEDKVLHLAPHEGPSQTYDAKLTGDCLELEQVWQDQKLVATFERVHEPPPGL